MNKIYESENYPLVQIHLEVDNFKLDGEAYADTGATVHGLFVPENDFDLKKIKQHFISVEIRTGDGKTHYWKSYIGKIRIKNKEFLTSVVIGSEKIMLGRDILDKLIAVFDGPNKKLILNES